MNPSENVIEFVGVTKQFGSFVANRGVSFSVKRGQLHGVIGENGAGKSTAMKMLYGMLPVDSGEIRVRGELCKMRSPKDALARKIGMVHQHFMLSGPESVLENILLGDEPTAFSRIPFLREIMPMRSNESLEKLKGISSAYGLDVPWDAPVESLPVGVQQRVEILKLLYRDTEVLILDEPTAVLTPQETDALFEQLRKLCEAGKTVLVITHKLREILRYTDTVTVFRRGEVVSTHPTLGSTPDSLAEEMVGRAVKLGVSRPSTKAPGEDRLRLDSLTLNASSSPRPLLSDCTFSVRSGEVLGIAGIEGNGQSDLLSLLMDPSGASASSAHRQWTGGLKILGENAGDWTSHDLRTRPVAFVPEDRHRQGLLLDSTLEENFLLGLQASPSFQKRGLIDRRSLREVGAKVLDHWDVRPRNLDATARSLSGGNQQKWILGREMAHDPQLLIVAQPTRGVDVGAIEMIHSEILNRRDQGAGVLLISSELDEVLSLSDRILVLYEGRVVGEFDRGQWDEQKIGLLMTGGQP